MLTRRLCNPMATMARESLIPWRVLRRISVTLRLRLKPALLCSMLMRALERMVFASFCCSVSSSLGSPFFLRLRLNGMMMSAFPIERPWKPLSARTVSAVVHESCASSRIFLSCLVPGASSLTARMRCVLGWVMVTCLLVCRFFLPE